MDQNRDGMANTWWQKDKRETSSSSRWTDEKSLEGQLIIWTRTAKDIQEWKQLSGCFISHAHKQNLNWEIRCARFNRYNEERSYYLKFITL